MKVWIPKKERKKLTPKAFVVEKKCPLGKTED